MKFGEVCDFRALDPRFVVPDALVKVQRLQILSFPPWHILSRELAERKLPGIRERYGDKYMPIARRQDNDDLACLDVAYPGNIVIVHDYAEAGSEVRGTFPDFWAWFRAAIEDMIAFD